MIGIFELHIKKGGYKMSIKLPKRGFVFWPVGTGDSSSVIISENEIIMQIDLHQLEKSKDEEDPHTYIVDELKNILPKKDGKPYLAVFVLTHPDKDHIKGFEELLKDIVIGEIWHTPRVFNEYKKDLCDDAKKFKDEVTRRKDLMIKNKGKVKAGDRLRIIGYDEIFEKDEFKEFPQEWRSFPGKVITKIGDQDFSNIFEAFVHAPFKDESEEEQNNTSLALQITLKEDKKTAKAFFFGDREYTTIKRIFEKTIEKKQTQYLDWDIMLVSHHCSKKVMYWKENQESDEKFRKDIMDYFEKYKLKDAYLIASCESDFSDEEGRNPPHKKARKKYEGIIDAGHFLCTHEHPNNENIEAIRFELSSSGCSYMKTDNKKEGNKSSLKEAVNKARGEDEPPSQKVGFGRV